MAKRKSNDKISKDVKLETLEDLINLNLNTLKNVVSGDIDHRKAALIFTGSRTVTSSLKLGIEAMKLGLKDISGVGVGNSTKLIDQNG